MTCDVEYAADSVRIKGEMTIYDAAALKTSLLQSLPTSGDACCFDLGEVTEIDTTGIQLLLMAQRQLKSHGISCSLGECSAAAREALRLVNIFGPHPGDNERARA